MERLSAREAAIKVLKRANEPLATKEIAKRVLAMQGVTMKGKTPEATIAAMLAVSNKKGGEFERTAPGVYRLRDEATTPEEKPEEAPAEEPTVKPEDEMDSDLTKAAAAADENARKAAEKAAQKPKRRQKATTAS